MQEFRVYGVHRPGSPWAWTGGRRGRPPGYAKWSVSFLAMRNFHLEDGAKRRAAKDKPFRGAAGQLSRRVGHYVSSAAYET